MAFALTLVGQGLEFTDALHLSNIPDGIGFASFDEALVKRATRAGVAGVSSLSR
jgi:hypothetical protein